MFLRINFVLIVTSSIVVCAYNNVTYEWRAEPWSGCVHRDVHTCCDCFRERRVHCAMKESEQRIAPFYCRKLPEPQPPLREKCDSCQQDCVFSAWGGWSACSETCTPSTRFRTRDVMLLPTTEGKECGNLLEIDNCVGLPHCNIVDARRKFEWYVGEWTSCRMVSHLFPTPTSLRSPDVLVT